MLEIAQIFSPFSKNELWVYLMLQPAASVSASQSVSLSSPTINTENDFYCKTHRENAYYFLKAIIACVVFSLLSLCLTEKASVQSITTSPCLYFNIDCCSPHIMLAPRFSARSHCRESKTGNGFLCVSVSVSAHTRCLRVLIQTRCFTG